MLRLNVFVACLTCALLLVFLLTAVVGVAQRTRYPSLSWWQRPFVAAFSKLSFVSSSSGCSSCNGNSGGGDGSKFPPFTTADVNTVANNVVENVIPEQLHVFEDVPSLRQPPPPPPVAMAVAS